MADKIAVIIHTEPDGSLGKAGLEAVGTGKALAGALGSSFSVGLVGKDVQGAADTVASCGATGFFGVAGADFADARYGSDAAAVEALVKASGATVVVAPGTSRFARVLAGVAARLNGRVDAHVTRVAAEGDSPAVSRWFYRQRIEAGIKRTHRPWIISIDPGSQEPWKGDKGSAKVEAVAVSLPDAAKSAKVTGVKAPAADQQTIRPDAETLLVAGAGWTKKQADGNLHVDDAAKLIMDFITKSRASLGGSKSAVDMAGEGGAALPFMTHLHQVGQTGATPRHLKGLATCCHGEEPHVVGWRFITERRAVNINAGCGWAQGKADVLYVADAFDLLKKVNERLKAK
jgi:electron transfer flavoprotein alpha subunit